MDVQHLMDDQRVSAYPFYDQALTDQWLSVTFNASKTQLVTIHHHRANNEFLLIIMNLFLLQFATTVSRVHSKRQVELIYTAYR